MTALCHEAISSSKEPVPSPPPPMPDDDTLGTGKRKRRSSWGRVRTALLGRPLAKPKIAKIDKPKMPDDDKLGGKKQAGQFE